MKLALLILAAVTSFAQTTDNGVWIRHLRTDPNVAPSWMPVWGYACAFPISKTTEGHYWTSQDDLYYAKDCRQLGHLVQRLPVGWKIWLSYPIESHDPKEDWCKDGWCSDAWYRMPHAMTRYIRLIEVVPLSRRPQ